MDSIINNTPLVSINILSYNRKDELKNTLQQVCSQNYKSIEVIVVDNDSSDGTSEMVTKEFPEVKFMGLNNNVGISGWNEGFKIALGEYILVLDDDSYPDKETIQKGIDEFQKNDRLGIVAFEIFNTRIKKSETKEFLPRPYLFVGCGALIKKELLNKIGYYNEDYFIYLHELDYSARCYDHGYEIMYLPSVLVFHNQNMNSRGKSNEDPFRSRYRYKYYFINYSIFLIQRFPLSKSVYYLLKWIGNRLIVSLYYFYFFEFFSSLFRITINFEKYYRERSILKYATQKFYNYGNVPLIDPAFFRRNAYS